MAAAKIYLALPVLDEFENLPALIACYRDQDIPLKKLVVCVNQPESWWAEEKRSSICENNRLSLEYLKSLKEIEIEIIDRSSPGKGWNSKSQGVGWARKIAMDRIASQAHDHDLIISMDADTHFNPDYFRSVSETFSRHPDAVALAVPYLHPLTDDKTINRAILRYEIYMRHYAINLWRIGSHYAFTAIGSAMALPVSAYQAIRGITPHRSGEDFYFLQKLRKFGRVLTWNPEKVYPSARLSDRVVFGTGPALIKGVAGNWKSYPVYPFEFFDKIRKTMELFSTLYGEDRETPLDDFIRQKFRKEDFWRVLRRNARSEKQFVKSCHHRIDAFRTLQFLKWRQGQEMLPDEMNLISFMTRFYPKQWQRLGIAPDDFSFKSSPVSLLESLRDVLAGIEEKYQRDDDKRQ